MAKESDDFIPTRLSLLSRLKNWEDHESWLDFLETYGRLIYRVAIKHGLSPSEAEDALQETILSVAKNIKDFHHDRKVGSFKGWLLQTTHWRIIDVKRRRQREMPLQDNLVEQIADDNALPGGEEGDHGFERLWESEWNLNLLYAATQKVKRQVKSIYYQAYDLHVIHEQPAKEVAERLDINPAKVYYARYKVGGMLKRELLRLQKEDGRTYMRRVRKKENRPLRHMLVRT